MPPVQLETPSPVPGSRDDRMPEAARVLRQLAAGGYRFTTTTPATHERVLARRDGGGVGTTWRDIFGWNLPFDAAALAPALRASMQAAGFLRPEGSLLRSTVRIASLDDDVFLHSEYPTTREDAVFFGPDTYRFARFLHQALATRDASRRADGALRVLDVGCGSGAGGIAAVRALAARGDPEVALYLNDINPLALRYAAVNADVAGIPVTLAPGDALSAVDGAFDLIVCNPPYLDDPAQRAYRHGGARLGRALGVRIAADALARLAPGGQLLLYTGVAIVEGLDPFIAELQPVLSASGCAWSYAEIDPDVFGEELAQPAYAHVDRIAAVGLVATRARAAG